MFQYDDQGYACQTANPKSHNLTPLSVPARTTLLSLSLLSIGLIYGQEGLLQPSLGMAASPLAVAGQQQPQQADDLGSNTMVPLNVKWTNSQCGNCHRPNVFASHPVGVRATMRVPGDLPLENGVITCMTCHDGESSESHRRMRQEDKPLLRGNVSPAELCARCHEALGADRKGAHANALQTAHLKWDSGKSDGPSNRFESRGEKWAFTKNVDAVSQICMSCHDGLTAPSATGDDGPQWIVKGTGAVIGSSFLVPGSGSHPVGMRMGGGGRRMGAMPVRSGLELNQTDMQLVDGRVSCITCHSLYSSQPSLLVMSNEGSQLCLACHIE